MVQLLQDIARGSERRSQPFVTVFFGNPYTAMGVPEAPAMLLTYDFSDAAERSAVRAHRRGDRRSPENCRSHFRVCFQSATGLQRHGGSQ